MFSLAADKKIGAPARGIKHFHVVLIRPSTYDDDGYVIRFWRGVLPSNTLACLSALTQSAADAGALGGDVQVHVHVYDDTVQRVPMQKIARLNGGDSRAVVGLVGVQSNQFVRASDLALAFREAGVHVMIGGFHVSGTLALFERPSRELQLLLDHGVTLVKGEAEAPGAFEAILRDAANGTLKPIYDIREFPDLEHAPVPRISKTLQHRYLTQNMATIDTSRGCPFGCSFCTIINVQGRKMRYRSAACVLHAIEDNYREGITEYFFTDDNFARNPAWEQIFDGLIELKRSKGVQISFMLQTDTLVHRLPNFISKAAQAGCHGAFIGMESVNPANLKAVGKHQNRVEEYAEMVELWHKHNVLVQVGYIIGLPDDTLESVRRDIAILRDEVKVDLAAFFMLTPFPGSQDHRQMILDQVPMDADLNNFDTTHETFRHARMAPGEWRRAFEEAMLAMYDKDSIINSMLRTPKSRRYHMFGLGIWYRFCALEGLHPMLTGFYRLKDRRSRRASFPRETIAQYAWRRLQDAAQGVYRYAGMIVDFHEIWMLAGNPDDPRSKTLRELRDLWTDARTGTGDPEQTLAACRDRLQAFANQCRNRRTRRLVQALILKSEVYLRDLDLSTGSADLSLLIHDAIVTAYEEIAFPSVAWRRRANRYRQEALSHLSARRLHRINPVEALVAGIVELVFMCRLFFFMGGWR